MHRLSRRGLLQSSGALLVGGAATDAYCAGAGATPADRGDGTRAVRLNYNESAFGPSPRATAALRALGDGAWQYGYDTVPALRSEIAAHVGVAPDNVFVGEGSGEVLKLVALLHGAPGQRVVAPRPTFPMLANYAARRGADITWVPADAGLGHDFAALSRAIDDATRVVYVCNPDNPTGTLAEPRALRAWITESARRALVVVDEAYVDFAADPARNTVVDLAARTRNVLVTRSFSKLHGLAGLRVGYGVGDSALIRQLEAMRISIPNQAGVACARASLTDATFAAEVRGRIRAAVDDCARLFTGLRLRHVDSHANFMLFDTGADGRQLIDFARARGVWLAAVDEPLASWVRVTMGRPQDMRAFADTLRAWRAQG